MKCEREAARHQSTHGQTRDLVGWFIKTNSGGFSMWIILLVFFRCGASRTAADESWWMESASLYINPRHRELVVHSAFNWCKAHDYIFLGYKLSADGACSHCLCHLDRRAANAEVIPETNTTAHVGVNPFRSIRIYFLLLFVTPKSLVTLHYFFSLYSHRVVVALCVTHRDFFSRESVYSRQPPIHRALDLCQAP